MKKMASNGPVAEINIGQQVTNAYFHPLKDIIAVSDVVGDVKLYSINRSDNTTTCSELRKFQNHKKSVRCVRITPNGAHLYTAGKDKSWCRYDLETGQLLTKQTKAHGSAIYSLEPSQENLLFSGDEDGVLRMWDMRRLPEPVMELKENEDFISDMVAHHDNKHLLVTSGDGTLSCVNMKRRDLELQSENFDTEFLCLAVMKDDTKVVCGDGEGVLQLFNWSEWGNISDRYPAHPGSIDSILPLSDDFLCTGCEDGKIRLVHIIPNSIEQVIGTHGDFPVQTLTLSHDATMIASSSHDEMVKLWKTPDIDDITVNPHAKRSGKSKTQKQKEKMSAKKEFFNDL